MSKELIIKIVDLKKSYNSNLILNGISLQINRGEIFSLLGPDESGKTTLMEILVGLKKPSEGSVEISGYNILNKVQMREIKKIIGFLPQEFRTHDNLTVKENIQYWGKFYDKRLGLEEILSIFKLTDYLKVPYKKLPSNLKRKLGLAIAFINDPEIIFLDEPTKGLDPFARKEVWEIIKEFKKRGKTIFITTNHALDPHAIADRVAIIYKGSIKDLGTPMELIDRYSSGNKVIVQCLIEKEKDKVVQLLQSICPIEVFDDNIIISSKEITLVEILEKLEKANIRYSDIVTQKPTLNDVFITLTGEQLS